MEFTLHLKKGGNITLPKKVLDELKLEEGNWLTVKLMKAKISAPYFFALPTNRLK